MVDGVVPSSKPLDIADSVATETLSQLKQESVKENMSDFDAEIKYLQAATIDIEHEVASNNRQQQRISASRIPHLICALQNVNPEKTADVASTISESMSISKSKLPKPNNSSLSHLENEKQTFEVLYLFDS